MPSQIVGLTTVHEFLKHFHENSIHLIILCSSVKKSSSALLLKIKADWKKKKDDANNALNSLMKNKFPKTAVIRINHFQNPKKKPECTSWDNTLLFLLFWNSRTYFFQKAFLCIAWIHSGHIRSSNRLIKNWKIVL